MEERIEKSYLVFREGRVWFKSKIHRKSKDKDEEDTYWFIYVDKEGKIAWCPQIVPKSEYVWKLRIDYEPEYIMPCGPPSCIRKNKKMVNRQIIGPPPEGINPSYKCSLCEEWFDQGIWKRRLEDPGSEALFCEKCADDKRFCGFQKFSYDRIRKAKCFNAHYFDWRDRLNYKPKTVDMDPKDPKYQETVAKAATGFDIKSIVRPMLVDTKKFLARVPPRLEIEVEEAKEPDYKIIYKNYRMINDLRPQYLIINNWVRDGKPLDPAYNPDFNEKTAFSSHDKS
jgi:hypothetical protein